MHDLSGVAMRRVAWVGGLLACVLFAGGAAQAQAQTATGLTVVQRDGFATLRWNAVAGATDYQIERTPVDAADAAHRAVRDPRAVAPQSPGEPAVAGVRRCRVPPG